MTLSKLVMEQGIVPAPDAVGSHARGWAPEEPDHPREVIEAALAHVVQNNVGVANARTDRFEHRRRLVNDWAAYLDRHADDSTRR